jgi:hypothetical protein
MDENDYYNDWGDPPGYDDAEEFERNQLALDNERDIPDQEDDDEDARIVFANPGSNSALRAASASNPRNLPCPNCGRPNRLTPADRAGGYQCDACADAAEGPGF